MTKQEKEFARGAFCHSIRGRIIAGLEVAIPISLVISAFLYYSQMIGSDHQTEYTIWSYLLFLFSFVGPFIHGYIEGQCLLSSLFKPTEEEFRKYQLKKIEEIERIMKDGGEKFIHGDSEYFIKADYDKLKQEKNDVILMHYQHI